jgi:hypothetical protein
MGSYIIGEYGTLVLIDVDEDLPADGVDRVFGQRFALVQATDEEGSDVSGLFYGQRSYWDTERNDLIQVNAFVASDEEGSLELRNVAITPSGFILGSEDQ